jgi:branched-chain amino acid transport system ATP-binding protein
VSKNPDVVCKPTWERVMPEAVAEPRAPAEAAGSAMLSVRGLPGVVRRVARSCTAWTSTCAAAKWVTLLGRNGAGKTTTLRAIMGIVPRREGSIVFEGEETVNLPSNRIARRGIAYCPEERGIFSSLNVFENLMLPPVVREGGSSGRADLRALPNLKERRGSQGTKLSGGEQQMLAIGRILRTGARLLLLDEPTEGLAPVIVQQIGRTISRLKQQGFTILLVEQNFRFAATVATGITSSTTAGSRHDPELGARRQHEQAA